jgi:hypothetical protein
MSRDPMDRLEREVAAAFEDVLQAQPGDSARLDAMIAAAMQTPPPGGDAAGGDAGAANVTGMTGRIWLTLVGGITGIVVASAVLSSQSEHAPVAVAAPIVAVAPIEVPLAPPRSEAPAPVVELVVPVEPRDDGTRGPRRSRRPATPRAAPTLVTPEDPDALLRAANAARRARRFPEAEARYAELTRRFPESRAARASRVSHGRLLLDLLGRPADALACFSAYLHADPRGTLAEEALVGRAQALRRLDRAAEAREAWRALLAEFPDSAHAPAARGWLAEAAL